MPPATPIALILLPLPALLSLNCSLLIRPSKPRQGLKNLAHGFHAHSWERFRTSRKNVEHQWTQRLTNQQSLRDTWDSSGRVGI